MSQLSDSDEAIARAARELQSEAYMSLEILAAQMQVPIDQIRGFSPAGRQPFLLLLKSAAAQRTETEVSDITKTYDAMWRPCCGM